MGYYNNLVIDRMENPDSRHYFPHELARFERLEWQPTPRQRAEEQAAPPVQKDSWTAHYERPDGGMTSHGEPELEFAQRIAEQHHGIVTHWPSNTIVFCHPDVSDKVRHEVDISLSIHIGYSASK